MNEEIKVFGNDSVHICPFCESNNILPFEKETDYGVDPPIFIIVFIALGILLIYITFIVASYLFFPVVVFVLIIIATKILNKKERNKHRKPDSNEIKYLCLNCDRSFSVMKKKK